MRRLQSVIPAIVVLGLTLSGCSSGQKSSSSTSGSDPQEVSVGQAINTVCPVSLKAVDPAVPTRRYEGKTVGFCCDHCPASWDKKSVAERDAMLARIANK